MTSEFDNERNDELVPRDRFVEQSETASEAMVKAAIAARYTMSAKYPRRIEVVRDKMLHECKRPSFCMPDEKKNGSSVAIYRVPRGKDKIEGVTIRFAEMTMRSYGNLGVDIQPLGEDTMQRIYLVTCTDYESNNIATEIVNVPKTIERSYAKDTDTVISQRTNSYGKAVFTVIGTDDEIAMRKNALISKARRNLILQHVPGWLVEECTEQIRATAAKKDAEDPDAAKRKLLDAFAGVGVSAQMLIEFIGHPNQLTPAELDDLRGYYGALREGYTTWAEIAATKSEGQHDDSTTKRVDELLTASGRTPAQMRNLKAKYVGRAPELLKFLEGEAAKKADTGAQTAPAAGPAPVEETRVPANLKDAAQAGVAADAQRTNHSAPPPVGEEW